MVGQHGAVHGAQEQQHYGEEAVPAAFLQLKMFFMGPHIRDGLKADDGPHDGYDQDHDQGQVVSVENDPALFLPGTEKVQAGQQKDLQYGQDDDDLMVVFETDVED